MQRRRVGKEGNTGAIRALQDRLSTSNRPVLPQRYRHRALVVCHRRSVRPVEAPGDAPFVLAQLRPATRKIGSGLVVISDAAGGIGRVNGGRPRVEYPV